MAILNQLKLLNKKLMRPLQLPQKLLQKKLGSLPAPLRASDVVSADGYTLLHRAVMRSHVLIVKALVRLIKK